MAKEAKKTKAKKHHKNHTNQNKDEEKEVEFIFNIIGDSNIRDALLRNEDFVTFKETDSNENVQRHLGS